MELLGSNFESNVLDIKTPEEKGITTKAVTLIGLTKKGNAFA